MPLTQEQFKVEQQIILWGVTAGFSGADIGYLVKVAYIESSFNNSAQNPSSTASGAFGFNNPTWQTYYSDLGSKDVLANQLAAMGREIQKFSTWYNDPAQNGNIPKNMTREEYMYMKHHDGQGATPSKNSPGSLIWTGTDFNPTVVPGVDGFQSGGSSYEGTYDIVWDGHGGGIAFEERTGNVEAILLNAGDFTYG